MPTIGHTLIAIDWLATYKCFLTVLSYSIYGWMRATLTLSWDLVKIDMASNKVHQWSRAFSLFFFFQFCDDVAEVAIIHKTI
jgi:hypothetical protein